MLTLPTSVRVHLTAEPIDLRRGHDGLVAIVRNDWKMNPYEGHLYVFFGRRLDRVKILVWDRNGFVLHYKRLSRAISNAEDPEWRAARRDGREGPRDAARRNRREVREARRRVGPTAHDLCARLIAGTPSEKSDHLDHLCAPIDTRPRP
jgi:hypothetical protein